MKISCPYCNKTLYTNPFGKNEKLDCPYCHKVLVRTEETNQLLKVLFIIDFIIYGIAGQILDSIFPNRHLFFVVMLCLLGEYMFEIPQRTLLSMGKLIYEEK